MVITIALMIFQNRIILKENEKVNSAYQEDTYNVLIDAMSSYADDVGRSCLNIVEHNFEDFENLGQSVSNYTQMLYSDKYAEDADTSYGVAFAGGKTKAAISEINDISDVREYISTYYGYNVNDLDNLDIFLVTENGLVIDGTNENYGDSYKDLRKEQWYIDCKNSMAPLWTGVITGSVTSKEKIDYVSPIIVNGTFKGITVISLEISTLYNSLLKSNLENVKEIDLLDTNGKKIMGGSDFDNISGENNLSNTDNIVINDDACWISYTIPNKSFIVCFEFKINELYKTVEAYQKNLTENNNIIKDQTGKLLFIMTVVYILMALILIPLAVYLSGKMGHSIVTPLLLLSKKAENFGKDSMDIDVSDIKTDDEVGLLY